jgi:hypothetical protein
LLPPVAGILLVLALASYTTMLFGLVINTVGFLIYYCRQGSICDLCCKKDKYEVVDVNVAIDNDLPPIA